MNVCATIRTWLEANGPHVSRDVAAGVGITRKLAGQMLAKMVLDTTVSADGSTPRVYSFVRHAVPLEQRIKAANVARGAMACPPDPEERKRRNREANRAYYLRHRDRLLVKKQGRCRALTEEQKAARRLARRKPPTPAKTIRRIADASVAVALELKAAPKVEQIVQKSAAELMAEFLAKGGEVQTLPPWATSEANQFKRIGRGG